MRRFMILAWVLAVLTPPLSVRAESIYEDAARLVPSDANLLVLIDSERIRRSAFYKQEKLDVADAEHDTGRQVFFGPQVAHALLASKIRGFHESQIDWELAILSGTSAPSLTNIALTYGGTLDHLATTDFVSLPTGAMVIGAGPKSVAVLSPADKPRANRIVNLVKSTTAPTLSKYLTEVHQQRAGGADAVLAVDLDHLLSRADVLRYLKESQTFKSNIADALKAQKVIDGVRGLTLRVKLQSSAQGELTIDFTGSADGGASWAKELSSEVLNDAGAAVDLSSWTVRTSEKKLIIEGPISMQSLRQIFSLVSSPTDIPAEFDPNAVLTPEQETTRAAKATLTRYRSTQKLLEDLRNPENTKNLTTGANGKWFEKHAQKIEQLPSLNVDKVVLDYCDDVVTRLRVQATRYRMVGIKAGQYSQDPKYVMYYYGNWYGGRNVLDRVESDAAVVGRFERAAAAADKFAQFEAIDKAGLETRRAMTEKYKTEF